MTSQQKPDISSNIEENETKSIIAIISGKDFTYKMYKENIVIGRNSAAGLVDIDMGKTTFVSREHLEVIHMKDTLNVKCLGKNGIFINDIFKSHSPLAYEIPKKCVMRFPSTNIKLHLTYIYGESIDILNSVKYFNNTSNIVSYSPKKSAIFALSTSPNTEKNDSSDNYHSFKMGSYRENGISIDQLYTNHNQVRNTNSAGTIKSGNVAYSNNLIQQSGYSVIDDHPMSRSGDDLDDMAEEGMDTTESSIHSAAGNSQLLGRLGTTTIFIPSATRASQLMLASHRPSIHGQFVKDGHQFSGDSGDETNIDRGSDVLKPPYSYAQLIVQAITSMKDRQLTLSGIYAYISRNYPYYKLNDKGWQNSIRHNLSLNRYFTKVARNQEEPGKGSFWRIDPIYEAKLTNQSFRKRRQRRSQINLVFNGESSSQMNDGLGMQLPRNYLTNSEGSRSSCSVVTQPHQLTLSQKSFNRSSSSFTLANGGFVNPIFTSSLVSLRSPPLTSTSTTDNDVMLSSSPPPPILEPSTFQLAIRSASSDSANSPPPPPLLNQDRSLRHHSVLQDSSLLQPGCRLVKTLGTGLSQSAGSSVLGKHGLGQQQTTLTRIMPASNLSVLRSVGSHAASGTLISVGGRLYTTLPPHSDSSAQITPNHSLSNHSETPASSLPLYLTPDSPRSTCNNDANQPIPIQTTSHVSLSASYPGTVSGYSHGLTNENISSQTLTNQNTSSAQRYVISLPQSKIKNASFVQPINNTAPVMQSMNGKSPAPRQQPFSVSLKRSLPADNSHASAASHMLDLLEQRHLSKHEGPPPSKEPRFLTTVLLNSSKSSPVFSNAISSSNGVSSATSSPSTMFLTSASATSHEPSS